LDIKETSKDISVNSLEIDIEETKLEINGKTLTPSKHDYNEDIQTDKFSFDEELPAGQKATLTIKYTGILNDKMAGFYRSSYKDEKTGETKYMATTQMEPTDARRVWLQPTRARGSC
jgi:aminopeptidase 2